MEIRYYADKQIPTTPGFGDEIKTTVGKMLKRFIRRLTTIEVYFNDVNGAKSGSRDKRCSLEARIARRRPVAVIHHAPNAQLALKGALIKLQALLKTRNDKERG